MPPIKHEPFQIFEFGRIDFTQEDIAKFAPHHLQFLGQSCLAANDISIFLKMLLGHFHKEGPGDILEKLSALTRIIVQRHLQSKIFEFVKLMDDYHKSCTRKKDPIVSGMMDEVGECIRNIKGDKCYELTKFIRNKVTNHYAFTDWHSGAKEQKKGHKFELYMHQLNGNTFYPFAEEASHLSLLGSDKWDNIQFDDLFKWMADSNKALIEMQQRILIVLFKHYVKDFHLNGSLAYVQNRLVFDEDTKYPLLSLLNGTGRW